MRWITGTLALSVPTGAIVSILVLLGLSMWGGSAEPARAQVPVTVGIDMYTTGNSCPNDGTDCALGEIEPCIEVSATTQDQFDIDTFLEGLPSADSILGYGFKLAFSDSDVKMNSQLEASPVVNLIAQPGSSLIPLSDPVPDTVSPHEANMADFGSAEYNPPYTHGVLSRYTFQVLASATPGVYGLTLSNVVLGRDVPPGGDLCVDYGCDILDGNWTPKYGLIAVDTACPGVGPAEADLKVVDHGCSLPAGVIDVSQNAPLECAVTVHNNGPEGPVEAEVTMDVVASPDCTVTPSSVTVPVTPEVSLGEVVFLPEMTVHCTEPSDHVLEHTSTVSVVEPEVVDPDDTNNSLGPTPLPFAATAWADLKVVGVDVSGPAEINVSETATATVTLTLHNNGPYGPVTVTAPAFDIVTPTDCTAEPLLCVRQVELPTSLPQAVDCDVEIHCSKPSSHSFQVEGFATEPKDPHVTDPLPDNNSGSADYTVVAIAQADVEITGQTLIEAPSSIDVSESVPLTLRKTLHNNGPYGPVDVSITATATVPMDCTADPDGANPTSATLPASTPVVVDEVWTIHCTSDSSHQLQFDNAISVTTEHVVDPVPGNNDLHTDYFLPVAGRADVKILGQSFVDPPPEIVAGTDVDVTLRKTLHNNGPYGPVDVNIDSSMDLSQASGCTADGVVPTSASLPVSTSVEVDEVWTINCSETGNKTFTLNNSIALAQVHVYDPDDTNNAASTDLTVTVIPPTREADLKVNDNVCSLPAGTIDVSTDVPLECAVLVHNNGPDGPVEAEVTVDVVASPDCTVTPSSVSMPVVLDVSVARVAELPAMTVHCSEPSDHELQYTSAVSVTEPDVVDPNPTNNGLGPTPLPFAAIALADVKIASQTVDAPAQIDVSEGVPVILRKTLHNNGPHGPVNVSIDASATPLTGCTADPDPANATSASLPVSQSVVVDEVWTIHCSEPGNHTFSFGNSIAVSDAHVTDPNPDNNTASTPWSVDVLGHADAKIVGASLLGPPDVILVSESVDAIARTTLHNNGPYGPVTVPVAHSATTSGDCDIATLDPLQLQIQLPVSVDVVVEHTWTIHCTQPSTHTFDFETHIGGIKEPHVLDHSPANNFWSTTISLDVIAEADVKVTDIVLVDPPDMVHASESVDVTVRTTLHNNGAYGPVSVDVAHSTVPSLDCDVTTADPLQMQVDLPVSAVAVVEHRWTIHCMQPSTHSLSFATEILQIKEPHVADPTPDNNSGSTLLSLPVAGQTDVKIVEQSLIGLPAEIESNTDVEVTLRKTLHNNGPYGPTWVLIDAGVDVSGAPGCTATPDPANPTWADLPVSMGVEVDEIWTINCSETGDKSLVFGNSIEQQEVHVYDPDPDNNSVALSVGVTVVPPAEEQADVKVVDWVCAAPPEIPVSEEAVVECTAIIHNNGPDHIEMGASLFVSAVGPPDCDVPPGLYFDFITMPVSVSLEFPVSYRIHCWEPSLHTLDFMAEASGYLPDPDPTNNAATATHTVAAVAQADLKVAGVQVSGPTEIAVSENAMATVSLTLHNNGPYGPVTVVAPALNVAAPPDCTAEPLPCLRQVELPVSLSEVAECNVEIHCSSPSSHTFEVEGFVTEPEEPHVVDPNPDNNSGSAVLDVDVVGLADVKIVGQDFVDPPAEVEVGEDFQLTLRKALHNNGPYGPVDADIFWALSFPPGCSFVSWSGPDMATLPVSADVSVDEIYTMNCHELGPQTIMVGNSIPVSTPHVEDPDEGNNSASTDLTVEVVEPGVIEVEIDIKPGSFPNSINPKSKGVIPVAILTTDDFDALMVDADSVRFGPDGAEKAHKWAHAEDVDHDGDMDLVLHFRTQETGIASGDIEACLIGETYDGMPIVGCDSVRTVP